MMKQSCMKLVGIFAAIIEWSAIALLIVLVMTVSQSARAQSVTFGASATNANGELSTVLTWDAPGANHCVASGHPAWEGERVSAGTQQLPTITLSGTYGLTLACTWLGDTTARLSWSPPTQNTDGTGLANLAGYRILYGTSADNLSQTIELGNPALTAYVIEGLSPGTWYFAVKAFNSRGVDSTMSNVASKVITAAQSVEQSVALTVNPVPREPTELQVQ